jgi:hypothetical protein
MTLVPFWASVIRLGLFGLFTLRVLPEAVTTAEGPTRRSFIIGDVDVCLRSQSAALTLLIMVATLRKYRTALSTV